MADSCLAKSQFVTCPGTHFFESPLAYLCKGEDDEEQIRQHGWAAYAMLASSSPQVHGEKSSSGLYDRPLWRPAVGD